MIEAKNFIVPHLNGLTTIGGTRKQSVRKEEDEYRYSGQKWWKDKILSGDSFKLQFFISSIFFLVEHRAEDFHSIVEAINKNLKDLYMEIRQGKSEEDGVSYYALVCFQLDWTYVYLYLDLA